MMDTILNIGLNDTTAEGLAKKSGNERFAWDSYRRFVAMYGDVVLDMKPERKEDHDPFEVILSKKKHERGVQNDTRSGRRRPEGAGRGVQGGDQGEEGHRLPRRPVRAAARRDHGRVQLAGTTTGRWSTAGRTTSRTSGARRSTSGHGVRQHGRRLRHRRRLHPRPGHRRERLLRRVPDQRPGRGRGRRHPHAAEDRRAGQRVPQGLQAAARHPQEAREALPGHAGHRVHHRERQALHAPVPQRQAHRLRRRAHRRRHGRRGADHQGRGRCAGWSPRR